MKRNEIEALEAFGNFYPIHCDKYGHVYKFTKKAITKNRDAAAYPESRFCIVAKFNTGEYGALVYESGDSNCVGIHNDIPLESLIDKHLYWGELNHLPNIVFKIDSFYEPTGEIINTKRKQRIDEKLHIDSSNQQHIFKPSFYKEPVTDVEHKKIQKILEDRKNKKAEKNIVFNKIMKILLSSNQMNTQIKELNAFTARFTVDGLEFILTQK